MEKENSSQVYSGTCIWFKHAYGFLSWSKDGAPQKDIFVHYSDIAQDSGYKTLRKAQQVKFELGTNNNGDPKAINVSVIEEKPSVA